MSNIISILKNSGVGILPTDTLYGIVGSAFSEKAVERIYTLKGRDEDKPLIILINSIGDLGRFGVEIDQETEEILQKYWPGKVSVILPCLDPRFEYLHRGKGSLAFRLPVDKKLISILKETGPLVAPSANPQGLVPAKTIAEAKEYFGDKVDFYEDGGILKSLPSTLIGIKDGQITVLRKGALK